MKKRFLLFTACAALALGGAMAFSACGETESKVPEHEHVWSETFTTSKRATCSEEGERLYYCTVPGCTATKPETVEKTPHTWEDQPTNTATCESAGAIIWTCKVCGATEEGSAVPALGHDDAVVRIVREATCLQDGENEVKCNRCERTTTVPITKLEHVFRLDKDKSFEATCLAPGKEVYTCVNGCNQSREETIEKLDHEVEYEENILPTFESEGHRKGHCTVCNTEIDEVIPKLVDGEKIEFTYKIMKGKRTFSLSTTTFTIVNEKGETVATKTMKDVVGGRLKVKLPIHKETQYTIKLDNIKGYAAQDVTLTPADPNGEVQVFAKMYEIGDTEAPQLYYTGSMMQDFSFEDIDGQTVHLKEILKTKRVVMIDLFYSTCSYCMKEAPNIEALYNKYKAEGLEILGISADIKEINKYTQQADNGGIIAYRSQFGITYPLIRQPASETEPYLFKRFNIIGFPTTILIDHEGFVKTIGVFTNETLEQYITYYLSMKWDDLDGAQTVAPKNEADGLMLSVLRGDYLLGDERNF